MNLSTKGIFERHELFLDAIDEQYHDAKDALDYFQQQGEEAVKNITEKGTEVLQNVTNEAVEFVSNKLAQALHLHDFYSAHILTFCEVGGSLIFSRGERGDEISYDDGAAAGN